MIGHVSVVMTTSVMGTFFKLSIDMKSEIYWEFDGLCRASHAAATGFCFVLLLRRPFLSTNWSRKAQQKSLDVYPCLFSKKYQTKRHSPHDLYRFERLTKAIMLQRVIFIACISLHLILRSSGRKLKTALLPVADVVLKIIIIECPPNWASGVTNTNACYMVLGSTSSNFYNAEILCQQTYPGAHLPYFSSASLPDTDDILQAIGHEIT